MRAIIQKVKQASVVVNGEVISSIQKGLCILVGISQDDTLKDLDFMVKKILSIKLFEEDNKDWKLSVKDLNLEILCVSQFTLYAKTDKGAKPDFHLAMKSENSNEFYANFLNKLKQSYKNELIKDGRFGAMMDVSLINDGPVTISLDSRKFKYIDEA